MYCHLKSPSKDLAIINFDSVNKKDGIGDRIWVNIEENIKGNHFFILHNGESVDRMSDWWIQPQCRKSVFPESWSSHKKYWKWLNWLKVGWGRI